MMLIEKIAERSVHVSDFDSHNPGNDAHGQYAAGGVIRGPVRALLGERGPEVVVPMKKKFMNKKVKDVVKHFRNKQRAMNKMAVKKKKNPRIKAIGKGKISYGGYDEAFDGTMKPNSVLGNRQPTALAMGHGSSMGSLHSAGEVISATVRGGSTPNLR